MNKKYIVVTGGAGFVGTNLIELLLKKTNCNAVCAASIFHYHYINDENNELIYNKSKNLRLGKSIDTGNVEFINFGYGNLKSIQVEPCSIGNLKKHLKEKKIKIRDI